MKSDMDNKEWLDDYPSIKQVNQNNPFTVPDGYFDELHQTAMSCAFLDGLNSSADSGFAVPENYFEELPGNLQSRVAVEAALQNNAPGFNVPANYFEDMQANLQSRANIEQILHQTEGGFTVPEGYFEEMQANLQSRINIEELLHQSEGDFTVPADYFEDQHQQIVSLVAAEEILNSKTDGFTVPNNYFAQLQSAIISKTTKPVVKHDAIVRRLIRSSAFKYATAACVTVAVGATLFFATYESPEAVHKRSYIHKALAIVPDADIVDYLQNHMSSADTPAIIDAADQTDAALNLQDSLNLH